MLKPIECLFFIPLAAAGLILLAPMRYGRYLKGLAVILSLAPLAVLATLQTGLIGHTIDKPWIPALGIRFHLSVDSLSLIFLFLTAVIVPVSLLTVKSTRLPSAKFFFSLVLLLESFLVGFFTAQDLALFTLFWEAMLLPATLIIGIWGKHPAKETALKFLIYMLAGSAFFIAAVIALYFGALDQTGMGSFNLKALSAAAEKISFAPYLFLVFLIAFAVKAPLFPFHGWLPESYTRSSTAGTILLSAVLSKAGVYGILRLVIPSFPALFQQWGPTLFAWAVAGVLYGGLSACVQKDFKRLIAYSSFSHVNFILAGLFVWQGTAQTGAVLQSLNHGVTIAGLFIAAGWLEQRLGSTAITETRGVAKFMPRLCWIAFVFILSSVALPGTNNFTGEILIFFGSLQQYPWWTPVLGLTVILSVVYSLRFMQKIFFEAPSRFQETWLDLKGREMAVAVPLILLVFWVGILPAPFLKQAEKSSPVPVKKEILIAQEGSDQ